LVDGISGAAGAAGALVDGISGAAGAAGALVDGISGMVVVSFFWQPTNNPTQTRPNIAAKDNNFFIPR
jgi:hypothetical protein